MHFCEAHLPVAGTSAAQTILKKRRLNQDAEDKE